MKEKEREVVVIHTLEAMKQFEAVPLGEISSSKEYDREQAGKMRRKLYKEFPEASFFKKSERILKILLTVLLII